MSDNDDSLRWPAAKGSHSEGWGSPPIGSPWNFQEHRQRREQKHIYCPARRSPAKTTDDRAGKGALQNSAE